MIRWPRATASRSRRPSKAADGTRRVRVHQRDLTRDDTIRGLVLTLHDVTVQRRLTDELAYRANHDALTGLPNGQMLREELRRIGQLTAPGSISAALFLDLDNFKEVNDTLGHAAGDELLKVAAASRILGCLRRDRDLAARLGGDEFAVLLRNLHTVAAARDVAARLIEAFRQPIHVTGRRDQLLGQHRPGRRVRSGRVLDSAAPGRLGPVRGEGGRQGRLAGVRRAPPGQPIQRGVQPAPAERPDPAELPADRESRDRSAGRL